MLPPEKKGSLFMKDLLIGTLTRLGGPGICYVRTDGEHLTQLWTDGTLTDPNWQDVSPDGRIFSVSCDGPEPWMAAFTS